MLEEALNSIKRFKNRLREERNDKQKGIIFRCPYCNKTISRYTTACPKCKGILKRKRLMTKSLKRSVLPEDNPCATQLKN